MWLLILYGDDFEVLQAKAAEIEHILKSIPGAADVSTEQITGQPVLRIQINQEEIARYGIPADVVLDMVESLGGKPVGEVLEGQLRFPLVVRLPEAFRTDPETLGTILVTTVQWGAASAYATCQDRDCRGTLDDPAGMVSAADYSFSERPRARSGEFRCRGTAESGSSGEITTRSIPC